MAAMSENCVKVLNYLKEVNGENVTAADIGEAIGLSKKQVDGIVTAGLQKKGLSVRVPAEIRLADNTHKSVKFIRLTDAGMAFRPGIDDVEAPAEKEAE